MPALPSTLAFGTGELNKGTKSMEIPNVEIPIFIYPCMSACWCVLVIKIMAMPFCFAHNQDLFFFFNAKINQNITVFREGRRHLKSSNTCRWPCPFSQRFFFSICADLVLCSGCSSEWPWQDSWSWRLPAAAAGRPWGGSWTRRAWADKEIQQVNFVVTKTNSKSIKVQHELAHYIDSCSLMVFLPVGSRDVLLLIQYINSLHWEVLAISTKLTKIQEDCVSYS